MPKHNKYNITSVKLKAAIVHNNKYTYTFKEFSTVNDKYTITCQQHGEFLQRMNHHLAGKGCPKCAGQVRLLADFVKDVNTLYNNKYDYSSFIYINNKTKGIVKCPYHGVFEKKPSDHLRGQECPSCNRSGFNKQLPGILYYLLIDNTYYKIGITNRTVQDRFSNTELKRIKILGEMHYLLGSDAYTREQEILKEYSEYSYIGSPLLESGNTELFTKNVLVI